MKKNILFEFLEAINTADVDKIYSLMTDDHVFIDAHDNRVLGKEDMKQAWLGYFDMFPDYKIAIDEILENDLLICVLGYASGTYKKSNMQLMHLRYS